MQTERWQFWIDVGGTFTDCLAIAPDGTEHQQKLLSSGIVKSSARVRDANSVYDNALSDFGPDFWIGAPFLYFGDQGQTLSNSEITHFDRSNGTIGLAEPLVNVYREKQIAYEIQPDLPAPILAIHMLMKIPVRQDLPNCEVHLGTTKGTNALLTRTGATTALVTSVGLKEFLTIGDQTRPNLFKLTIQNRLPLFSESIEIDERVLSDGTVEIKPDQTAIKNQLQELKVRGFESLAVCLMHSYKFPTHETIVGNIAKQIGFADVRLSSQVAPLIKIVSRAETTVLDAYLNPVLSDYLNQIQQLLGVGSKLQLMTSAGSLTSRSLFSGKDSVLSGPAGGVVGAARIAQQSGFEQTIGFDMGGTSTDVSRFDGSFELEYESEKAGVRIMTPMMAIETVAAGGGSICSFDGTRLTVGPESAGAHPGPACYSANGPLTITDVNLILGRIDTRHFPFQLNVAAAKKRLDEIVLQLEEAGITKTTWEVADGFLKIANHNMASAIRNVSVAQGYDPKKYVMVSFGGAGGQHCCAVADNLKMNRILVHPKSSILSAYGIRLADRSITEVQTVLRKLSKATLSNVDIQWKQMRENVSVLFDDEGIDRRSLVFEFNLDLRYCGTDYSININKTDKNNIETEFARQHQRLYGYTQNREIEVVSARATGLQMASRLKPVSQSIANHIISPNQFKEIVSKRSRIKIGIFDWLSLPAGSEIHGPAIIGDVFTSTIVDRNWKAHVMDDSRLLLEKSECSISENVVGKPISSHPDPIELEIFNSSFQSTAEQMGFVLRNTAVSVNIKERLDFSCALFSETGDLVASAPHIPVHLGAMSETVKSTIRSNQEIKAGDTFVTNDPYAGGSHLPDVTVVTPVFHKSTTPVFWVGNRAHHAEIGGIAPGSMPANATRLVQEGVVIGNYKLIDAGQSRFDGLRKILCDSEYPSRNPDENLADITAQIAANQNGVRSILDMIDNHSYEKVSAYMEHIRTAAETKTRMALRIIDDAEFSFADEMDDGTKIKVTLRKRGDELVVDFSGTDPTHAGNLNANSAIVSSAITYVMRCLVDENIPLNGGILAPISIVLPECFLNPPASSKIADRAAVVGGNVETSQRIVDVLLGGLNLAAASQGTMNNWLVGDSTFGYYETIGGGSGATAEGDGADAVHCHMSNTRLTDPEILETRYPMILRGFGIRSNSGGDGKFAGGNGMIREIEFTRPLTLSILSSRRTTAPFGILGGCDGCPGKNILTRRDGRIEILPSQCERNVQAGDRLEIRTPGGGGFGVSPKI